MLDWLRREQPLHAVLYLPATTSRSAEDVATRLTDAGGRTQVQDPGGATWRVIAEHPAWGRADVEPFVGGSELIDSIQYAGNLTSREKAAARAPLWSIGLTIPARRGQVLADRKTLLRYAAAL